VVVDLCECLGIVLTCIEQSERTQCLSGSWLLLSLLKQKYIPSTMENKVAGISFVSKFA